MEYKKLITETTFNDIKGEMLEESMGGQKRLYITGPFLSAELKNRNGRIYHKNLIEREVEKFQSLIKSREALGEMNHPTDRAEINPREAAILITELHMDGNYAIGKAKVLSTPCGKILESLINDGVRMGVSSRGTGNLLEGNVVADDYSLITIDSVYQPSGIGCYSDPLYESVQSTTEWVLNESTGLYIERKKKIEEGAAKFNQEVSKHGSKVIAAAFKEFIKTLR